jgi:hypothetical protein
MSTQDSNRENGDAKMIVRQLRGKPVRQRVTDGYVDATAICEIFGKQWSEYRRRKSTTEFLNVTESILEISRILLVETTTGGIYKNRGTWVHPEIIVHFARWCCPTFESHVSAWVRDWTNRAMTSFTLVRS